MSEAMKFAAVLSKVMDRQTEVATAADVFNAATLGGTQAINRDDLGRIAVIWEGESIWMSPLRDPIKNIVYNAQAEDVQTVIVNGKVVIRDGVIPNAPDIKELARRLQAAGACGRISRRATGQSAKRTSCRRRVSRCGTGVGIGGG